MLLQAVDSYVVQRAITTMTHTILPHTKQFLEQLGSTLCTGATEQRSAVTAEELINPLELLFEFGEMHTHHGVDPSIKPIMLLGTDTKYIGGSYVGSDNTQIHSDSEFKESKESKEGSTPEELQLQLDSNGYPTAWHDTQVKSSMHCIVEACEPSCGLRWCRTYMLQRGRAAFRLYVDSLVDTNTSNTTASGLVEEDSYVTGGNNGDDDGDVPLDTEFAALKTNINTTTSNTPRKSNISAITEQGIRRIECLYVKLYMALRYVVRVAFTKHSDIMDAADMIQVCMCGMYV